VFVRILASTPGKGFPTVPAALAVVCGLLSVIRVSVIP
jgi:hypothetical protein